jgi:hypothetical protein
VIGINSSNRIGLVVLPTSQRTNEADLQQQGQLGITSVTITIQMIFLRSKGSITLVILNNKIKRMQQYLIVA